MGGISRAQIWNATNVLYQQFVFSQFNKNVFRRFLLNNTLQKRSKNGQGY